MRRAISYAIDRAAIVKAILFGYGEAGQLVHAAAGAVLRPEVAGHPVQPRPRRRPSWRSRSSRTASRSSMLVGAGAHGRERRSPGPPAGAARRSTSTSSSARTTRATEFSQIQEGKYQLGVQLLDDGHRRPGRARDVRGRPEGRRRQLVLHRLQEPGGHQAHAPGATRARTREAARRSTRRSSGSPRRTRSWGSSTTRRSAGPRPRK